MQRSCLSLLALSLLLLAACSAGPGASSAVTLTLQVSRGGEVQLIHTGEAKRCTAEQRCSYPLPPGSQVRLEALPAPGFFFSGWTGGCTGYTPCELVLAQDQQVTAQFEARRGDFELRPLADPVVVPSGTRVEVSVEMVRLEGFNVPAEVLKVTLEGVLAGEATDQVSYRYLPEKSGPERLTLELQGPQPQSVWTYLSAPARLRVQAGDLEHSLEFTLAVAPCLAGCGR